MLVRCNPLMTKNRFTAYTESPLAALLAQALNDIRALKNKYALNKKPSKGSELIEIYQMIKIIESTIELSHQTLLPSFSEGSKPGLFTIGRMMAKSYQLMSMLDALQTRDKEIVIEILTLLPQFLEIAKNKENQPTLDALIEIIERNESLLTRTAAKIPGGDMDEILQNIKTGIRTIHIDNLAGNDLFLTIKNHLIFEYFIPKHPLIEELVELTAQLLDKAPPKLEMMVPFFDPKSVIHLLHSGALGTVLGVFDKFTLEHLPAENPEEISYTYQLTVSDQTETFDMAKIVDDMRAIILTRFVQPMNQRKLAHQNTVLEISATSTLAPPEALPRAMILAQESLRTPLMEQQKAMLAHHTSLVLREASFVNLLEEKAAELTIPMEDKDTLPLLLELLCYVSNSLKNNQASGNIPFKEIDQIMAMLPVKTENKSGFENMLAIIESTSTAEEWSRYRKKQDDTFKRRPSHQSFCAMYQDLSQAVTKKITSIDKQLQILEDCERIKAEIKKIIPERLNIESELNLLQEQINKKTFEERTDLVARMTHKLQTYIQLRDGFYHLKDKITPQDKQQRITFISNLQTMLATYAISGNSTALLATLQEGIHRFPGKKLRSLLYLITEEILDLEQEPPVLSTQSVVDILSKLSSTQALYASKINALYDNIESMRRHAETQPDERKQAILNLANQLTADTDAFINKHGDSLPSDTQCQTFTKTISARLNSRAHLIEQDRTWSYIVANIALVLLLIPKLIHSKITKGHCSFFFDVTKTSPYIHSIENSAQAMCQP